MSDLQDVSLESSICSESSDWGLKDPQSQRQHHDERPIAQRRPKLQSHQTSPNRCRHKDIEEEEEDEEEEDWEELITASPDSNSEEFKSDISDANDEWSEIESATEDNETTSTQSPASSIENNQQGGSAAKRLQQTKQVAKKLGVRGVVEAKRAVRKAVEVAPVVVGGVAGTVATMASWAAVFVVPSASAIWAFVAVSRP